MPDDRQTVRNELWDLFGELKWSPYFDDYVTIGSYLSDPNQYRPELQLLENEVTQALDARIDAVAPQASALQVVRMRVQLMDQYRDGILPDIPRKQFFSKLLSGVLERFETEAAFALGDRGSADIILGNLLGKFNQELRQGRPLKDVGAGAGHGEYSHRIQWYLVGKSDHLRYATSMIYRDVANHRSPEKIGGSYQYLWMYLFDRDGTDGNAMVVPFKANVITDFRAPSNVNGYLRGDSNLHYPLLRLLLAKRYEKRQGLELVSYYAKKMNIPAHQLYAENDKLFLEILGKLSKGGIVIQR